MGVRGGLIRTIILRFEILLGILCIGLVAIGYLVFSSMGSIAGPGRVLAITRRKGGIIIRGDKLRSFQGGFVKRMIGIIPGSNLVRIIQLVAKTCGVMHWAGRGGRPGLGGRPGSGGRPGCRVSNWGPASAAAPVMADGSSAASAGGARSMFRASISLTKRVM